MKFVRSVVCRNGAPCRANAAFQAPSNRAHGIEAALESYRQGRVVDAKRAREIIDAALGR
jgi:hypothetical protein